MYRRVRTVMVLLCCAASSVMAQDAGSERQGRRAQQRDIQVYKLQHLEAREVLNVVHHVIVGDISINEGHNALIVRGTSDEQAQVEVLLEQLDVPRKSGSGAAPSELHRLQYRSADDVADVLGRAFPQRLRVTSDEATGTLLLNGHEDTLRAAVMMLQSLDTESSRASAQNVSSSMTISVDLILGTLGSAAPNILPKQLGGVSDALSADGVGGCSHLGHVLARLNENAEFSARGVMPMDGGQTTSEVEMSGAGYLHDNGQTAEVDFRASLIIPVTRRNPHTGESEVHHSDFGIETTTTVPIGDHLVLGAVPTSVGDANTVIMVIRITR